MAKNTYERVGEGLVRNVASRTIYSRIKFKGKVVLKSLETADRVVARNKLAELRRELEDETTEVAKKFEVYSITQTVPLYLATLGHMSESVQGRSKDTLSQLVEKFGDRNPNDLKPMEIEAWLRAFQSQRNFGADRWNKHIGTLRKYFLFLSQNEMADRDPTKSFKLVKSKPQKRYTPSTEEVKKILQTLRLDRAWAKESIDFIEFMALTGQGKAEINNLQWQDVNWAGETLYFYRQKTKAQAHAVPMSQPVKELLQRRWQASTQDVANPVFQVADVRKILSEVAKRIGIPHISHHAFRRYFVTQRMMERIPANVVAKWVGHKNHDMVMQIYAQIPTDSEKDFAANIKGL